jgi:hypothetical protein
MLAARKLTKYFFIGTCAQVCIERCHRINGKFAEFVEFVLTGIFVVVRNRNKQKQTETETRAERDLPVQKSHSFFGTINYFSSHFRTLTDGFFVSLLGTPGHFISQLAGQKHIRDSWSFSFTCRCL